MKFLELLLWLEWKCVDNGDVTAAIVAVGGVGNAWKVGWLLVIVIAAAVAIVVIVGIGLTTIVLSGCTGVPLLTWAEGIRCIHSNDLVHMNQKISSLQKYLQRINRQCHQISETTGLILVGRFYIAFTSIYSY
uniref:Uncharacterized protein n=1 Tax=Glossina palpalis gambiensis TaxID=67801 RepID=A0A1B0BLD0_9MUSC